MWTVRSHAGIYIRISGNLAKGSYTTAIPHITAHINKVNHKATPRKRIQHSTYQQGQSQSDTAQKNTAQHSTEQYKRQHSAKEYSTKQRDQSQSNTAYEKTHTAQHSAKQTHNRLSWIRCRECAGRRARRPRSTTKWEAGDKRSERGRQRMRVASITSMCTTTITGTSVLLHQTIISVNFLALVEFIVKIAQALSICGFIFF